MTSDYPFGIFKLFFHWNLQTWCPYRNIELFLTPFIVMLFVVFYNKVGSSSRVAQWVRSLHLITYTRLSPIRRGFAPGFVYYKKGALDSQPQVIMFTSCLPVVGGSSVSSTTKTGRHDIAEILLKVASKHQKSINQTKLDLPRNKNVDI